MSKKIWLGLVVVGMLAGSSWAQGNKKANSEAVQSAMKAQAEDPNYVIGPEDSLLINVWKEAEVSGPVPVRPDGKISMPLLNDVQAAGLTPMQLAAEITEKLKKFISEPRVTVTVSQINSRRVFMVGQLKAGAFPLLPNMTVLQALSAAGCCSEFANTKKIYVLRNENGKQVKYPFNFKEALKGNHPEQNIVLQPGDTIVVP